MLSLKKIKKKIRTLFLIINTNNRIKCSELPRNELIRICFDCFHEHSRTHNRNEISKNSQFESEYCNYVCTMHLIIIVFILCICLSTCVSNFIKLN